MKLEQRLGRQCAQLILIQWAQLKLYHPHLKQRKYTAHILESPTIMIMCGGVVFVMAQIGRASCRERV